MIAKELIAKIRKTKGPVYVETQNFNDVFYVQAVKSDLIVMIQEAFGNDVETGFDIDDKGYMGKDFKTDM